MSEAPTQDRVLSVVHGAQQTGAAWTDVADDPVIKEAGLGHSQISAALTALHRKGKIARLAEKRGGSSIYVIPELVNDRETVAYNAAKRAHFSPDHPCFDGRPILLGDRIQFTDQLNEGRLTDGRVWCVRDLGGEQVIEVEEQQGWLIDIGDVLGHTPKRG